MVVQLGGSKPATVVIGGSTGWKSTTPYVASKTPSAPTKSMFDTGITKTPVLSVNAARVVQAITAVPQGAKSYAIITSIGSLPAPKVTAAPIAIPMKSTIPIATKEMFDITTNIPKSIGSLDYSAEIAAKRLEISHLSGDTTTYQHELEVLQAKQAALKGQTIADVTGLSIPVTKETVQAKVPVQLPAPSEEWLTSVSNLVIKTIARAPIPTETKGGSEIFDVETAHAITATPTEYINKLNQREQDTRRQLDQIAPLANAENKAAVLITAENTNQTNQKVAQIVKESGVDVNSAGYNELNKVLATIPINLGKTSATIQVTIPTTSEQRLHIMSANYVDEMPRTPEEKRKAAEVFLNNINAGGIENGDNKLIADRASELVPLLTKQGIVLTDIVDFIKFSDWALTGDESEGEPDFGRLRGERGGFTTKGEFWTMNQSDREVRLMKLFQAAYDLGIPEAYAALVAKDIIATEPDAIQRRGDAEYITSGKMVKDMTEGPVPLGQTNIIDALKDQKTLLTIGGVFAAAGIIGCFVLGGPIGAMGAAAIAPFEITEFANLAQSGTFASKTILQARGDWAPDHQMLWSTEKSDVQKEIAAASFGISKDTPEENLKMVQNIKDHVAALKKDLGDRWAYLESIGVYDSDLNAVDAVQGNLDALAKKIDDKGNTTGLKDKPGTFQYKLDPGATVKINGSPYFPGDDQGIYTAGTADKTDVPVEVLDAKGNVIFSGIKTIYPGQNEIADYAGAKGKEPFVATTTEKQPQQNTIKLQPDQTLSIGGKKVQTGGEYKQTLNPGDNNTFTISQPGKTDKTTTTMYTGPKPSVTQIDLPDEFKTIKTTIEKGDPGYGGNVDLQLTPYQSVKIGNVDVGNAYNGQSVNLDPGIYTIVVSEVGKEDVTSTLFVKSNESQVYSVQGKPVKEPYEITSGGGGGGGGGGESQQQPQAQPMIIFGNTLKDCKVWLDEIEIQPVIGQAYGTGLGYHSVRATNTKGQTASKNVYCSTDGALEVNFSADMWSGTTPTPTPTPSTPEVQAKLIFGATLAAQRVWMDGSEITPSIGTAYDVAPGYHAIKAMNALGKTASKNIYCSKDQPETINFAENDYSGTGIDTGTGTTKIKFGTSLANCTIMLDTNEITPVIGNEYDIKTGSHTIDATQANGYYATKTIIAYANVPITFEFIEGDWNVPIPEPTSNVYDVSFNSDIEGAKILIGTKENNYVSAFSGEWTPATISLTKGLYKVNIYKTGYVQTETWMWVDDPMLQGQPALDKALTTGYRTG